MAATTGAAPLWTPSATRQSRSRMRAYINWLKDRRGLTFPDYASLWQWSVTDLPGFWSSVMEYFNVEATGSRDVVLADKKMPGARWFPGVSINYAANVFRHATPERPALLFASEPREGGRPESPASVRTVSWDSLRRDTAALAQALRQAGVGRGDRVAAFVPNIPEAVVGLLACASIGAIWSSCSPDFGASSVVDRFRQIEPTVLLAVDGYTYNGKPFDKKETVAELQRALPGLRRTVIIPYLHGDEGPALTFGMPRRADTVSWNAFLDPHRTNEARLTFEPLPFDHPLWILYSSGTTGLPKPIVQGHGGIVLEHVKAVALHMDLWPGDRLFWFTTTGWMMWNFIVGGMLAGVVPVLYDGSASYPDAGALWRLAETAQTRCFGTSAAYIAACMAAGVEPGRTYDLSALETVGSTGSPLSPAGFRWVYEHVKDDVMLASISGGTDVCTAFTGSCPLLPVYEGEMQCRFLGAKVEAFDEAGSPVTDAVGELVLTEPLPSMPLFFWNDESGDRLRESYFDVYPGVWRHGDWVKITPRDGCIIYGRSDSTINRHGVRMGTSEIYRAVETVPEVVDSLVIDLQTFDSSPGEPATPPAGDAREDPRRDRSEDPPQNHPEDSPRARQKHSPRDDRRGLRRDLPHGYRRGLGQSFRRGLQQDGKPVLMPLFVVLRDGVQLDADLTAKIQGAVRHHASPRHVPDAVYQVPDVPRTLNGKKLEVPVRKVLLGTPAAEAVNRDALANPEALDFFVALARKVADAEGPGAASDPAATGT